MSFRISRVSWARWLGVSLGLATAGCGGTGPTGTEPVPAIMVALSGDGQLALAGEILHPFAVSVSDASCEAVAGVRVSWAITGGAGLLCLDSLTDCEGGARSVITDERGRARIRFRPFQRGDATVTASVAGFEVSPVAFTTRVDGVLIRLSPLFDCTGSSDPVRFSDPLGSRDVAVPVGTRVAWEYDASLAPGCTARVVSTAAPAGQGFDSGVLSPGERFEFVPSVAGTWEFEDQVSEGRGTLTAR